MALFGFGKDRPQTEAGPESECGEPAPKTPRIPEGDLYRVVDFEPFPSSDGMELLYSRTRRKSCECPSYIADALAQCMQFQTLDQHLSDTSVRYRIDAQELSPVAEQLRELAGEGFLVSLAELRAAMAAGTGEPDDTPGIGTVGIVTADRVESLERCIEGHLDAAARHDRRHDLVVVDDSHDQASCRQCRSLLAATAANRAVTISYAGRKEKEAFLSALAGELASDGIPKQLLRWALLGAPETDTTPGANRNSLLLHCAGDVYLSLDDDMGCRPAMPPGCHDGLTMGSDEPTEIWFYENRDRAFAAAEHTDEYLLELHERMLARPVSSIARLHSDTRLEADLITPPFLRCLMNGAGRVKVTASGILGESGMSSPCYFLFISGATRERLWNSEEDYLNACTTRVVLRAARSWTVSENARLQMPATGLDNRDLLPPFMPVARNADGPFGMALRSCWQEDFIGHIPRTVRHDPPREWTFGEDDIWRKLVRLRTADFLGRLIRQCNYGPGLQEPRSRLEHLGRYLRGIGGLPRADFEEILRVERWRHLGECARHLEAELDISEPPSYIARDMASCLEHIAATSRSDDCLPPVDFEEADGVADPIAFFADQLVQFGELLEAWPTVVAGARRLREKEVRPARPVGQE